MTITPLSYIISRGTLEYVKFENGYTAHGLTPSEISEIRWDKDSFFDDDILQFDIKIGHNSYDKIITKWTVSNIKVFGGTNLSCSREDLFKNETWLKFPASLDPGILHRKISVEFVIWVLDTNPNGRSIVGSPLIVYC